MPKAKKTSSIRSTPYGVMSSEDTSEDRLAQFLTSDRSRRRSAVVDPNDSFSTAISLPLNLKSLTTTDADTNPEIDSSPNPATPDSDSLTKEGESGSEDGLASLAEKKISSGPSESSKCAESGSSDKTTNSSQSDDSSGDGKRGAATPEKQ